MEKYLKDHHDEEITNLLNEPNDTSHVAINVSLTHLKATNSDLFNQIIANTHAECKRWNGALLRAQTQLLEGDNSAFLEADFTVKEHCRVRFVNLPLLHRRHHTTFPTNDHVGKFIQIKGNVVRMTPAKLLEIKRDYICGHCKQVLTVTAEYSKMYVIEPPRACPNECKGQPYQKSSQPDPAYCIDFQEIRVQEMLSDKHIPASLIVTLESDLVDLCQPGDCITICGTIELRWKPLILGKRSEVVLSMRAISIAREEKRATIGKDLPEHLLCIRAEWQETIDQYGELDTRDIILKSICPEVHGMYIVKLAVALALCSGVSPVSSNGSTPTTSTRGNSHLLLIGDPGLAKSRIIKYAANIASRAIHTTGMGCSAAGLTAAAIKEDGEWQLEAGALVLADGGICCIDEFNLMRETDKASIHEAMEQQTISMAKAGLVCKLSTRCAVLAATNPKKAFPTHIDEEVNSSKHFGIASPLLSRFDIVLIIRDERNVDWDIEVADHVLKNQQNLIDFEQLWRLEELQTHFQAIRDISPVLTEEANSILGAYYKACRCDVFRDPARTTVRLLDSLVRLAQAHARLLFRNTVTIIDAVMVVQLMESSYGFGKLLRPIAVINEHLPLGPSPEQIKHCLDVLNLSQLCPDTVPLSLSQILMNTQTNIDNSRVTEIEDTENLVEIIHSNPNTTENPIAQIPEKTSTKNLPLRSQLTQFNNHENLDEMLSLEEEPIVPKPTRRKAKSDKVTKTKKRRKSALQDSIFNVPQQLSSDSDENAQQQLDFNEFALRKNQLKHRAAEKSQRTIERQRMEEDMFADSQSSSLYCQQLLSQNSVVENPNKLSPSHALLRKSIILNSPERDESTATSSSTSSKDNNQESFKTKLNQFEFREKSVEKIDSLEWANLQPNQTNDNENLRSTISQRGLNCSSSMILASQSTTEDLSCMDDIDF